MTITDEMLATALDAYRRDDSGQYALAMLAALKAVAPMLIEPYLAEIAELKQVIDDMVVDMNATMGDRHE